MPWPSKPCSREQDRIPIHVFPFRMTEVNFAARTSAHPEWRAFWLNLKVGYDLFEHTRVPPKVGICNKQYAVTAGDLPGDRARLRTLPRHALKAMEAAPCR